MTVAVPLCLAACAHFPLNQPLQRYDPDYGYRVSATSGDTDDSQQLLLVVTFSGGGTRAAAFAYGVLRALAEARVEFDGHERRLVDEIDVISSVSGGSFAGAYFALYGERIFDDFESRFLERNVQGALIWRLFSPLNWLRLASPYFGRSDLAAEYYDNLLFEGATLGDLLQHDGPALLINATDMTLATRFAFDQEQFDLLCSDSLSFPIARAVAASSAAPMVLSPVTLKNYAASGCGYEPPAWVGEELERGYASTRRHQEALRIAGYLNGGVETYVHLLDGGLADNLGLRLPIEKAVVAGGYSRLAASSGFTRFRRLVYIVVNAQTEAVREWNRSARAPGMLAALNSASTVALNRYNFETVELFRRNLDRQMDEVRQARCDAIGVTSTLPACNDIEAHFIEIAFTQHPDPAERAYLVALPTTLRLPEADVDRVVRAARRILTGSPEFQAVLADLAGLQGQ